VSKKPRRKKETGQKYNVRICSQGGHNKFNTSYLLLLNTSFHHEADKDWMTIRMVGE